MTAITPEALVAGMNDLLRVELGMDMAALAGLSSESNPWKLCVQCHAIVETAATSLLLERFGAAENSTQGKTLTRLPYRTKITLAFGDPVTSPAQSGSALLPGLLALGGARNRRAHNIRNFQLAFEDSEVRPMLAALSKWAGIDVGAAMLVRDLQAQGRTAIVGLAVISAMLSVTGKTKLQGERTRRIIQDAILQSGEKSL